MSIRFKNDRPIVEIYDPAIKAKRHVKPAEHGMTPPPAGASRRVLERWARTLEARALEATAQRKPGHGDETIDTFASRWTRDFPRGESTNIHNAERVAHFARLHAGRPLRSFTQEETRPWALQNRSSVPALRAMFNDAISARLCDANPFARLGITKPKGREGITVLTRQELDVLTQLAIDAHGEEFGAELAAMITWAAYTCCRPGEIFAARYSLLDGDVYHLEAQFNSRLRKETAPKHGGVGAIYVPEPAQHAVLAKPRRIGDDLMFRTKRGKQFRQGSLHEAWKTVRSAFMATLPPGHHLRTRLALDPDDRLDFYELRHFGASYMLNDLGIEPWVIAKQLRHTDDGALVVRLYGHPTRTAAIEKMRRAFGGDPAAGAPRSGDEQGIAARRAQ